MRYLRTLARSTGPGFITAEADRETGDASMKARGVMLRTVARLNIEHFRRLLAVETNATKRETIQRLLAEEEAGLEALTMPPREVA